MAWIKAKLFLITVAAIWLLLILLCSWFQLPFTALSIIKNDDTKLKRYVWGLWIWQDQAINALLGGNPDVTISSKVGTLSVGGSYTARAMEVVIDKLFKTITGQLNHCFASIETDEKHYSYFWSHRK